MNRNIFKVIFSKTLGQLTVVSENTTANGKTASESTGSAWGYSFAVNPLSFVLMLTMGTAAIIPAQAQVIADKSVGGNQQPTILNTASGVTQINIQTPSAAGVSMNQYSQFDINSNGAILNNSRTNVNTQTAGMVQGNPWLARGSAKVIVNQVNSSNPSYLNGYVEVAGQKAEVIIANPAGINVDGGGFINASRTTLTTGAPIINGGSLEGYRVTSGQITVDGKGLDTSQSDYTDILARSVKVNAGIWANNLKVIAGANQVDAQGAVNAIASTGAPSAYAIDTAALGGMYANKIILVGTEQGLGINNAGQIAASAGNVQIDANGQLTNSGTISSNGADNATQINTTSVTNSGTISAQGNNHVNATTVQNSGTLAAGREIKVNATDIDNSNGVMNGQRIEVNANSLNNTNGKIQQTGAQALALKTGSIINTNGGLIGYEPITSGTGTGTGSTDTPTTPTDTPSTATGGGTTTVVQPEPVTLADGAINVTGNVNNNAGQITANGGIDLDSSNGLTNAGTLNLNKLTVTGNALDNSNGTITTTQASIHTDSITNTAGKFGSSGNIDLAANNLTNTKGTITAGDTLTANITGVVLNDDGTIASNNDLTLNAGSLNNANGIIASNQAATTVTSQGAVNNNAGKIQAQTAVNLTSTTLDNSDGNISSTTANINTNGNQLTNNRGSIMADDVTLNSGAISNDAGLIQGTNTISINSNGQTVSNTNSGSKGILSGGTLNLQAGNLTNTAGSISSNGAAQINAADVDNTNGTLHTDSELNLTANSLTNTTGNITAGTTLAANVAQNTSNSGTIASDDALTLNTASLDNSGTIGANQAVTVHSTGAVKNAGLIQAATQLNLSSSALDNSDGQLNAGGATTVSTGVLNNNRGTIAGTDTHINSAALTNDASLIQGTNSLNLNTNGQTLTNTNTKATGKGLISGGQLDIASGNLDNSTGQISSTGELTIAAQSIVNQNGSLTSQANTSITGTTLDNQNGQIQTNANTSIHTAGALNNASGLIRSNGDTTIEATSLNNSNTNGTDQGVEGNNVTINANDTNNSSGAIRADETLAITGNGTLNNTAGLITSSKVIVVKDSNPAAKTLAVINTGGTIAAGTSNTIDANSLTADGKLISQGDLSIGINNDFNNTSELSANGNLTLNTTGTITNTAQITAGQTLTLGSNQLYNEATGEISSADTHLNIADAVFNRGLIDGGNTVIKTQNLNNIGTGRIYGDHVSIATNYLGNLDETIGGVTKAATIAARDRLDIGATIINNLEHASLISLGDMSIGGSLDSNNLATGQAATLNNESATIDAGGKLAINVGQLNNINKHFATAQAVVGTEQRYYYKSGVSAPFFSSADVEVRNSSTGAVVANPNQATSSDRLYPQPWNTTYGNYSPVGSDNEFYYRDVIATTSRTTIAQTDPGQITSGGAMDLTVGNILNDKSQIIAGGVLTVTGGSINNVNATGTQQTIENGRVVHTDRNGGNRWFSVMDNNYIHAENPTTINLDGIAVVLQNTNAVSNNTVDSRTSTTAAGATGTSSANASNAAVATGITEVNAANDSTLVNGSDSDAAIIRSTDVNSNMPNSSLFSVNPNGSGYLVQTDPRFTNASQWLSSDYMLKALNFDPANAHKRLGDGYYEQKLIKEQIAQLTGRRYLDGNTSDDEQYKNLMNAGVTFANQYNLRPGIALTPEQMARLTSDIVWLVEQEVTLPDGTKTTALVPKVYVRTKPGDITGAGALLSGDVVKLNLTGDVNNQGTISGRRLTRINAENINNLNGRIGASDATILNARTDINNVGGTIDANNVLAATAGRDVNVISTTSTATSNGKRTQTSETGVDRIAGLYVNNPNGLLIVDAGNNVNLQGADIITADGGVTSIQAGQDVNLTTIAVSSSINTKKDSKNFTKNASTSEVGTVINSGTVYIDAGHNLNARQAEIAANDGVLAIKVGNDVNLETGQTTSTNSGAYSTQQGKRKSNFSGNSNSSTDVGSSLSGQGVVIQAGHDVTATAANVDAGDGQLYVNAGHDLTIQEGRATFESTSHQDSSKKSGLFGINKKSSRSDSYIESDTSISSNFTGDSVTLIAGNDYEQSGSNVVGLNNVGIQAGRNATIESSIDTYSENSSSSSKKSGFTAGYSAGVASVGYGKSSAAAQNSTNAEAQNASTVASINGNTTIKAGEQLTIAASDVGAGNNLTLVAKDIDLEARQDEVEQHGSQQTKSSGFSIGVTVNPYAAGKAAYDASKANSAKTGTTMNTIMNEFRASNAALAAATTPIVITAGSKKSSANQDHATSTARTTSLVAGNNLTMIATDGSIDSQGTQMSAEGNALILARDNINFDVAHNYESESTNSKKSGWSLDNRGGPNLWDIAGVYKNKANGAGATDTITGAQLSVGGTTTLATTEGDITLTGSNVVSNGDTNINAARNLTIQSGQDTAGNENHSNNKAIGKVQISDTEVFAGYHTEKHNDNGAQTTQVSSNVASLGGNVSLTAGEKYTQTASNVLAGQNVDITGKSVEILTAQNTGLHHDDDKSLKVGLFARISSPLIDLINNVDAARQSDGRLQAMQGMAAAANVYQAASAASALAGGAGSGALIKGEVGVGVSSAKSQNDSNYSIAQSSTIKGGNNVNITSTEGDIHAVGAEITAGKALTLDSADNILLEAGQSETHADGKNKSWGVEVGVGYSIGAQTGAYVYGQANISKGKYISDSETYNNTHLAGETINFKSKGDTTLKGADATAKTINADVGGTLTVESVQDTAEMHSKQTSTGGRVQVSFGTAWEVSGNFSNSKADGTFTGVNQQSGLFAGDGGYHVTADKTVLTGGAITSTNAANSELTTNSLTLKDLENKMEYEADTASISASFGGGSTNSNGSTGHGIQSQDLGKISTGSVTPGFPMSESGENSSTTYATLTGGKIKVGGVETTAETTGAHTDAATAHEAIDKLPDLQRILDDQKAMSVAASTVISTAKQISGDIAKAAEDAQKKIKDDAAKKDPKLAAQFEANDAERKRIDAALDKATTPEEKATLNKQLATLDADEKALVRDQDKAAFDKAEETRKHWGVGGDYSRALNVVTGIIVGGVAGQGGTQIASNAAAPYAAEAIGEYFKTPGNENQTMQVLSHAVLGAALAYANGSNIAGGAAAGAGGEAAAQYLTQKLYPEAFVNGVLDPSLLTEAQKSNVVALATGVGALVSGAAGQSWVDASVGAGIAENAVVNNQFGSDMTEYYAKKAENSYREYEARNCAGMSGGDCLAKFNNEGIIAADLIITYTPWGRVFGIGGRVGKTVLSATSGSKKAPKAANAPVGSTVQTPTTNPENFRRGNQGTYVNKDTGEVYSRSNTNHSSSSGGEWKVSYEKGASYVSTTKKVTVSDTGVVIKHDR